MLARIRPRSVAVFAAALTAFTIGWTLGSRPFPVPNLGQNVASLIKREVMPSWEQVVEQPNQGAASNDPVATEAVMRLDQDESVVVEGRISHEFMRVSSRRDVPDSAEAHPWKKKKQDVWRIFIMFQHNLDILKQAVRSYEAASTIMAPNMIIIDNSVDREASNDPYIKKTVKEVVLTPSRLNFPQLHNFMAGLALDRRLEFYFWAHADNYVLPMTPMSDLGKDVLQCLAEHAAKHDDWAGVFYSYDHLAAFKTRALIQVPWDPHVFQYGSECDAYGRIKTAGNQILACKVHLSYDMKRVVDISPSDSFETKKAKLEQEAKLELGRNEWREQSMSEAERQSRLDMKLASREYLKAKWGVLACKLRGVPCSKPWPFCPVCPADLPDCHKKSATWKELDALRARIDREFKKDPLKPLTPAP